MNISVDTSYWDTPLSIREVVINKQLDFIRRSQSTKLFDTIMKWVFLFLTERINLFCLDRLDFFTISKRQVLLQQ